MSEHENLFYHNIVYISFLAVGGILIYHGFWQYITTTEDQMARAGQIASVSFALGTFSLLIIAEFKEEITDYTKRQLMNGSNGLIIGGVLTLVYGSMRVAIDSGMITNSSYEWFAKLIALGPELIIPGLVPASFLHLSYYMIILRRELL
jgi:hypothetical protein